ncbi:DgyrCDS10162 [Dimorphilus gyrociliatus]|uniref:DgyrCDS10162 n=1 Tax=Dimorphilus gyrociliatus TaxID=2664684 RepID=A0A7I8W1E2_9ANNE|nr:DgyrCDS10162 [Dimorphilus gyrociliatus]
MEKWAGKVAIITGASEGMGNLLSKQLVEHGVIVAGVARTQKKLKAMEKELQGKKGRFHGFQMNLTEDKSIHKAVEEIEKELGPIAILVNMGSTATGTPLIEDSTDAQNWTLEINVVGACLLMKLAIESMRKNNIEGHIINVGGTASYFTSVFDDCHFYSVSKFILRALGDALRMEFRANNIPIRIGHIGPGHVTTGAQTRAGLKTAHMYEGFKEFATEIYEMSPKVLPKKFPFNADGDNIYHNDILPALTMEDVISTILRMLSSPQGAEIMDIIMKPTDRRNNMYETDLYWRS